MVYATSQYDGLNTALRKSPFRVAKEPILEHEMGFIGHQKSPFRTLKWALSQNRHRNTAQQHRVGRCIEKGEH